MKYQGHEKLCLPCLFTSETRAIGVFMYVIQGKMRAKIFLVV